MRLVSFRGSNESSESFKHRNAKIALAGWLREAAELAPDWPSVGIPPCIWAPPGTPDCGVRIEYPICIDQNNRLWGLDPVWDGDPPSYGQCIAQGLQPLVIFDVAIQQQRRIAFGLEVVHRSPPSPRKLEYLKRIRAESQDLLNIGVIDADWILSQFGRPSLIEVDRLFWSRRIRFIAGDHNAPQIVLAETARLAHASCVPGRSAWTTNGPYRVNEVGLPGFVQDIWLVVTNQDDRWPGDELADYIRRTGRQCSILLSNI